MLFIECYIDKFHTFKKIKISLFLILLWNGLYSFAQTEDDFNRQMVLKNNITDSLYVFGKWSQNGETETQLKYLGLIKTDKGNFKIMTSFFLWGLSKRVTSRILIFNEQNEYLGNYYVGGRQDFPEKIEMNQLLFLHAESDECDKKIVTRLSFEKGIPEQFFIECKEGYGDIYAFEKE